MRVVLLVLLVFALAGCPQFVPPGALPSVPYHTLPGSADELRSLADQVHRTSRQVDELVRARTALKKAEYLSANEYETLWRLARVDGVLARLEETHAKLWALEGRAAGEKARQAAPDRVEGHLYYAICTGHLARHEPARAESLSQKLIEGAQAANKADPKFAHGEARRVLGAIYIYAPAWPSGVGDLDEAIEVLEAVYKDFPTEPLNAYYLAEAYRRTEQHRRAYALYKAVRKTPPKGIWRLEGPPYRKLARRYMLELKQKR